MKLTDCTDCINNGGDWECDHINCHKGDCISRQDAIDGIYNTVSILTTDLEYLQGVKDGYEAIIEYLKGLPSAQPKMRGKWIDEGVYADYHSAHAYRCSVCGNHIIEDEPDPYCRWCGADMRGKQDDEAKGYDCNDCYLSMQNCHDKSICYEDETSLCDWLEKIVHINREEDYRNDINPMSLIKVPVMPKGETYG